MSVITIQAQRDQPNDETIDDMVEEPNNTDEHHHVALGRDSLDSGRPAWRTQSYIAHMNRLTAQTRMDSKASFANAAYLRSSTNVEREITRLSAHGWRTQDSTLSQRRRWTFAMILYSSAWETIIGVATMVNFVFILVETDLRAKGNESPVWLAVGSVIFLLIYTGELAVRTYVERLRIFESGYSVIDIIVVSTGWATEISNIFEIRVIQSFSLFRILRCFRMFRIAKAAALMNTLPDLRKLLRGISSCIKTLFWSLVLIFLFMTVWSVLSVELVHPLMADVARTGVWADCERCADSFVSVMEANLTLFKTIVAGDSWGLVAIPTIEMFPWTCLIFVGALFTLQLGVMNLIIAVLVQTASEANYNDVGAKALQLKAKVEEEVKVWKKFFRQIDANQDGTVTLEELRQGIIDVPDFAERLQSMDIHENDLAELFALLDSAKTGRVTQTRFIEMLYTMKCGDNKTAIIFVKHCVTHLQREHRFLLKKLLGMEQNLSRLLKNPEHENTQHEHSNVDWDSYSFIDASVPVESPRWRPVMDIGGASVPFEASRIPLPSTARFQVEALDASRHNAFARLGHAVPSTPRGVTTPRCATNWKEKAMTPRPLDIGSVKSDILRWPDTQQTSPEPVSMTSIEASNGMQSQSAQLRADLATQLSEARMQLCDVLQASERALRAHTPQLGPHVANILQSLSDAVNSEIACSDGDLGKCQPLQAHTPRTVHVHTPRV